MDIALMDAEQRRRYTDEIETALVKSCEEQGSVVLPPVRDLAVHFGLPVEWAASVSTLLVEQADAELPEHMTFRNRPVR